MMRRWPILLSLLTLLPTMAQSQPTSRQAITIDPDRIEATNATVHAIPDAPGRARIDLPASNTADPTIALNPPDGHWNLSRAALLRLDVRVANEAPIDLRVHINSLTADGKKHTSGMSLEARPAANGQPDVLTIPLDPKAANPLRKALFGMRGYPRDPATLDSAVDLAHVESITLTFLRADHPRSVEIGNLRTGDAVDMPADDLQRFFPFIDEFGQYIHAEWPGKLKSEDQLRARAVTEARELAAAGEPADWNRYGGYTAGPKLQATGFFRTAKHDGKWWLVDPDGRLFWSHGVDCVRDNQDTPTDERDAWFARPLWKEPDFKQFVGVQHNVVRDYYQGKSPATFNIAGANLLRKYGREYKAASANIDHRRLRAWGLNTIANWSDADIYLLHRTPYTATINTSAPALEGSSGYWGKFKDVFAPEFGQKLAANLEKEKDRSIGDPWCIGFFVDNELSWGDEISLARAALASPVEQPAKVAFLDDLKKKYGRIDQLNSAWGTDHASWDALLASRHPPDAKRAGADLRAFNDRFCEHYFATVRDALKLAAPNQLYLGCRFAWSNPRAVAIAARYCDVVSFNKYGRTAADLHLPAPADKPIIIGEFHFGATDRGLFHPGLVRCADQADRAKAYRAYLASALHNPAIVGTGWFQYRNQPTTGRSLDGENFQIGLVDITDTPYPEMVQALRDVAAQVYPTRLKP